MAGPRSTRASAAVDRLKLRSGNAGYSMARTGEGLFFLSEKPGAPPDTLVPGAAQIPARGPSAVQSLADDCRRARNISKFDC